MIVGVLGTEHWLEQDCTFSSSSKRSRNFDSFCAALEGELAKKGRCVVMIFSCSPPNVVSVYSFSDQPSCSPVMYGCCSLFCRDEWIKIFLGAGSFV